MSKAAGNLLPTYSWSGSCCRMCSGKTRTIDKKGARPETGDSMGRRGDRNPESGHCRHTAGTVVTVCVPATAEKVSLGMSKLGDPARSHARKLMGRNISRRDFHNY